MKTISVLGGANTCSGRRNPSSCKTRIRILSYTVHTIGFGHLQTQGAKVLTTAILKYIRKIFRPNTINVNKMISIYFLRTDASSKSKDDAALCCISTNMHFEILNEIYRASRSLVKIQRWLSFIRCLTETSCVIIVTTISFISLQKHGTASQITGNFTISSKACSG